MAASKPFREALENGDMDAMKALIVGWTNIDERFFGYTVLMEFTTLNYFQMIPFLVEHGADMHATTSSTKDTALHLSARNGHVDCIHALMKCGANLELENEYGMTPLDRAIVNGEEEVFRVLLDYGAKVSAKHFTTLAVQWPREILATRKLVKQTSLVFLALAKRTRILSKDMRSIISSLLWAGRNYERFDLILSNK